MKEIKLYGGESIDTVVEKLLKAKTEGRHVFCNFNDVKLYSDNITIDSANTEICGITKEELDEKMSVEEARKRMEEHRKRAIENIPNVIERGKALIYPFRHEEWAKLVEADAHGDYCGGITEDAIEIMTAIEEEKSVEELLEIFKEQGHSGRSAGLTRKVVMTYSKNGYPFYKATRFGKWTKKECEAILKIMQDNEEHSKDLRIANSVAESRKEVSTKQKRLVRNQNKGQL